jgi:hypothetical protein
MGQLRSQMIGAGGEERGEVAEERRGERRESLRETEKEKGESDTV